MHKSENVEIPPWNEEFTLKIEKNFNETSRNIYNPSCLDNPKNVKKIVILQIILCRFSCFENCPLNVIRTFDWKSKSFFSTRQRISNNRCVCLCISQCTAYNPEKIFNTGDSNNVNKPCPNHREIEIMTMFHIFHNRSKNGRYPLSLYFFFSFDYVSLF